MIQNIFKRFVVLCLAGFLMITPYIFAENNSEANNETPKGNTTEQSQKSNKIPDKPRFIKREHRPAANGPKIPSSEVVIPPLKITVKSIVGEEENDRYAVIEFEGEELTVRKDQIVKNKFKVVDIFPDRMVVYSRLEQRRHTYKLVKEEENKTN